jgi:uncharacterized protein (DUF1501 family)
MSTTRREVLNLACRGIGAGALFRTLGATGALAQSAPVCGDYKALVCVFFFGGNDATNMVAPVNASGQTYADYNRIRSSIALAQNQLQPVTSKSGSISLGLHPRLVDLRQVYDRGNMAVVLNVGSLVRPMKKQEYLAAGAQLPGNLFSHSDQQAEWQNSSASALTPTGWGGRVADRLASCNAATTFPATVSLTGNTIFGAGVQTRLGTVTPITGNTPTAGLQGFGTIPNPRYNAFRQLLAFDNGVDLVRSANRVAAAGVNDADLINKAVSSTAIATQFPNTSLGQQLRTVARMIESRNSFGLRRQIFFCSLGGFDTHQNQISAQDSLLAQVGPAIAAFFNATVELGVAQSVTTFTSSEFSRTVQPNSNVGSDHAWGGHHLVIGGAVKGDVYGTYPSLALAGDDDANNRGVFIPTISVDQYNATLAAWFGVAAADIGDVFPNLGNFSTKNLGFLG